MGLTFICTPSHDYIQARTTYDLVNMVKSTPDCVFSIAQGTYINNLREGVVKGVCDLPATHLMFIDSDMMFPSNSLTRLLKHDKDIIGANYRTRIDPSKFTAKRGGLSLPLGTGIEEADTIGMGVTLIKMDVFKKMPQPWFNMSWNGKFYEGEDESFCNKARLSGFSVWVDNELSKEVKHIGTVELGA